MKKSNGVLTCDVCGIPFTIEKVEPNALSNGNVGLSEFSRETISIDSTLSPEMQESTLIHEWIHMVLVSASFLKEYENENLVSTLQNELYRAGFRVPVTVK